MQISRYTPPNRTGYSRLLPQQPCRKQFSLARVGIERYRQYRSAFRDEGEQSGKANRRYENKMYSEPGRVNALGTHLFNGRGIFRLRRLLSALSSTQDGSISPSSKAILAEGRSMRFDP